MLSLTSNADEISAQLIEAGRRLPIQMTADFELAYFDSIEMTEQSVQDMLLVDEGKLFDLGITGETRNMNGQVVIDERQTLPIHAFEAKQTPEGVEVYVVRYAEPVLYRKAFLYKGGVYVRVNRKAIKKVADIHIWDWAGPRRMAEQIPETFWQKFQRLFSNSFELILGKGTKQ